MRLLLVAIVAGLGIGFLVRRWRQQSAAPPSPESTLADDLREKLAESRAAESAEAEAATEEPAAEGDVDARRREVHERAREAIEKLGDS
jgi:hypothetical protein